MRTYGICWIGLTIAIVLSSQVGCAARKEIIFVPTSPVVAWSDLVEGTPESVRDSFRLIVEERTTGVFPTSITVARLAAADLTPSGDHELYLACKPEVDFLMWNSVFDDFRSIGEVFPLNPMALDGEKVRLSVLLRAARDLGAGMLLVYTENQPSVNESELRGALYDVNAFRLLAVLHAGSFVDDPVLINEKKRYYEAYDDEDRDPRLVSIHAFEGTARRCLIALMRNDDPAERVSPEGWIPDRPIEDLIWPPSEDLRYPRHRR